MSKNPPPNALKLASKLLLKPYDLDFEDLDKVFSKLYRHKLDYADLYFQYHRSEAWSLEEGIVKSGSFNIEQGVGVRAITGEKTAFAYSDDISLKALKDAADATRAIADSGRRKHARIEAVKKPPQALYRADNQHGSLDDFLTTATRVLDSPKLLPLRESWANDTPIPWVRIHNLPDYVYFDHSRHVTRGVGCVECHGRIDQMEVVAQNQPLSMSWCLECHRNPAARLRPPEFVTKMDWEDRKSVV